MSEFALPLSPRERGWVELRERLARAARELHFSGFASNAGNGPALLVIAGNLAGLALSIPERPVCAPPTQGGLVDASTLFATQILQRGSQTDGDTADVGRGK